MLEKNLITLWTDAISSASTFDAFKCFHQFQLTLMRQNLPKQFYWLIIGSWLKLLSTKREFIFKR